MEKEKNNPKLKKNGGPGTAVGNFLRGLKKNILPSVLDAVGVGDMARAMSIISDDPKNAGLTADEAKEFFKLAELDIQDRASARDMQTKIATSANSTILSKNYIYYLASFWSIVGAIYIFLITFFEVLNARAADTVLGFLLGTIVATIISYFFGSNLGSKDQNDASVAKKLTGIVKKQDI